MAKITTINDGEAGSSVRSKLNTAMASVETDATISGDGNVGTALSVDASQLSATDIKTVYESNADTNAYTDAEQTKVGHISVTQAVDLDDIEDDVADLRTLSGTADEAVNLGTFTGATISDNGTIKAGMQELETALEGSATVHSDISSVGSGSIITTAERSSLNLLSSFANITDPAIDAATTTAVIDANQGTIITTTTAGNNQTLANPTSADRRLFFVGLDASSTDVINVNDVTIQVGQVVKFAWDGSEWINDPLQNTDMLEHSTGIISGGVISINADNTKVDIGAGEGNCIDASDPTKPISKRVTWNAFSAVTLTNLATNPVTYLSIGSNGTLIQQTSLPTRTESRDQIFLGVAVHSGNTVVLAVNNIPYPILSPANQVHDLIAEFGTINDGNVVSANGANLNIDKSSGSLFKLGINFQNDPKEPHKLTMAGSVNASFRYRLQNSTEYGDATAVDPENYDNAGVLTALANNKWSVQRFFLFPSNIIRVQYGQASYDSKADALQGVSSEAFTLESNIDENGTLIGILAVKKGTTDLSDISNAVFLTVDRLGQTSAGASGLSTATLQTAYDNSVNPEILTDATLGAVSLRRGSGADSDSVLEVQNNAGTNNFSVTGEGNVTLAGTVDGRDIAADGTTLDNLNASGLSALTTAEVDQLENIDTVTISNTQWGYLGATNQGLATTDNVGFADLTLSGNLTVNGTTTTINSTTMQVDDKNIELGTVDVPTDVTADGGGITLKGATDKTIIWDNANDNWTTNQNWNLSTGLDYKINNVSVLNSTTLGSSVVNSSLTSVGTLSSLAVTGDLTVDTDTLHVDSTNDRVGVNQLTPQRDIHVTNNGSSVLARFESNNTFGTGLELHNSDTGANNWSIFTTASGNAGGAGGLAFFSQTSNTGTAGEKVRITGEGNVGIGQTAPEGKLHVETTGTTNAIIESTGAGASDYAQITVKSNASGLGAIWKNPTAQTGYGGAGSMNIGTFGAEKLSLVTNNASRLTIGTTGNVGIGGDDGTAQLTIARDGTYNSEGTNGIKIQNAASSPSVSINMGTDATNGIGFIQAMEPLVSFATKPLVLQGNGGNVGVGITNPQAKLTVGGGTNSLASGIGFEDGDTGIYEGSANQLRFTFGGNIRMLVNASILASTGSNNTYYMPHGFTPTAVSPAYSFKDDTDTGMYTSGADTLNFSTGGTERFSIDSSGNVGIGTTDPSNKLHIEGTGQTVNIDGADDTSAIFTRVGTSGSSGQGFFGVEGSVGGSINTGTTAYATYFGAGASGTVLQLGTPSGVAMTLKADNVVNVVNTPTYADDTAAGVGGLVAGDIYKTAAGDLKIKL